MSPIARAGSATQPRRGCVVHLARVGTWDTWGETIAQDLSDEEKARSRSYRSQADRARFELGALLVRHVAGRVLRAPRRSVTVDRSCDRCARPHGAPRIPGSGVHLSVSHSGELVLLAESVAGPVGIDVEEVTAHGVLDDRALVERVCAPSERPHASSREAVLTYWTRKESVLKATGEGLRVAPSEVVVTPPDSPPRLLGFRGLSGPPCRMVDLDVGSGYRACLAVLTSDPVEVTVEEPVIPGASP